MGDILFVGSCSGQFLALNRHEGTKIWSYDTSLDGTPAQFHGNPVVVDGAVITGCDRSSLSHTYAFSIATGDLIWKEAGTALETDLTRIGNIVVGRRWNGDLVGMEAATGERAWVLQPKDYIHRFRFDCSPAARGDTVVVGGVDGVLYAVDGEDGKVIWTYDSGSAFTTAIAINGDDIYVGLADQSLLRISCEDGAVLDSTRLEKSPFGQPVVSANEVFVMTGRGELVTLSRNLADRLWVQTGAPSWTTPRPLLWHGAVLVGKQDGTVCGFHQATGDLVLELKLEGRIRGLGAHGDVVYVGAMNGNLYACRPRME